MLLPPARYGYEKVQPLNNIQSVESCEKDIQLVTNLNDTAKVLLGAQNRIAGIVSRYFVCLFY